MVTLDFQRAGDIDLSTLHYSVLLYGTTGAGKSWAAATAPDPTVLLADPNGKHAIRTSNPDARIVDVQPPDPDKPRGLDVVGAFLRAGLNGELPGRTLVFDSITEIQRLLMDRITAANAAKRDDGKHVMTKQDWGTLAEEMRSVLRSIRKMPYHTVLTALHHVETEEETGTRWIVPMLQGRAIKEEIGQWFNVVGYVLKRSREDDAGKQVFRHYIMLDGPERYVAKSCHPLHGILAPDLSGWFDELAGAGVGLRDLAEEQ